jgi:hypothetical protein
MFGLFSKNRQIHAIAKRLVNQSAMTEPVFALGGFEGLEWMEANAKCCDVTKGPILIRILLLEYVLVNFARAEIGVTGATEKDWETLVDFVANEMESHPMFGEQALCYWVDLKNVTAGASGGGYMRAPSKEALAMVYGFWFLKNIGYPNVNLNSSESVSLGIKLLDKLRKIFGVH